MVDDLRVERPPVQHLNDDGVAAPFERPADGGLPVGEPFAAKVGVVVGVTAAVGEHREAGYGVPLATEPRWRLRVGALRAARFTTFGKPNPNGNWRLRGTRLRPRSFSER